MTLGNQNNLKTKKETWIYFSCQQKKMVVFGECFLSGFIFSNVDACC